MSLFSQTVPPGWKINVILCDDGSSDATVPIARSSVAPDGWSYAVRSFIHDGPSAIRNHGISLSGGDVVVFLQADILLLPGALAKHLEFHASSPDVGAALGWVKWDPRINPTPLMEWMAHGGPQNDYDALLGRKEADPRHYWYGAHLSVKRSLLSSDSFSTVFTGYGWEDLDLGRRMASQGVKLQVLHEAIALHRHYYSAQSIIHRQVSTGVSYPDYASRYPKDILIPPRSRWHKIKIWLAVHSGLINVMNAILIIVAPRVTMPRLYLYTCSLSFWRGVYRYKQKKQN